MAATTAGSEPLGTLTRILTFCFVPCDVAPAAAKADTAAGEDLDASRAALRAATLAL